MTRPWHGACLKKRSGTVPLGTVWGTPGDDGGVEGRNRSFPQRGGHPREILDGLGRRWRLWWAA